jgi:hypothetical protein
MSNQTKLEDLAKVEGKPSTELLEEATFDSIAMGICINPRCTYTNQVEPDQSAGYCEKCGTNTVKSCLVLAGII